MKITSLLTAQVFIILVLVSLASAQESERCEDPCGKPTEWNKFNAMHLKVSTPGLGGYQSWRATFDNESGDIQIEVETSDGNQTKTGDLLLIGGRVLAIKGPIAETGYESDALDAAVLHMRLVVRLLGQVIPEGPVGVSGDREIDFKDDKTGVHFATPGAQGLIAAPWRVTGSVTRSAHNDFGFNLELTASSAGPSAANSGPYHAILIGHLSKMASAKIADTVPLEDWKIFTIGPKIQKVGTKITIDYGSKPAEGEYRQVSDIRMRIATEDYPGEPDSSKNFTGFWKEDCSQAFGLQIMPFGTDGKYSVTFCGPGGCGKAGEDGKNTFITKDPDYEVISENELKIRNAGDGWDTYYRCTRDIHPILKYKDQQ